MRSPPQPRPRQRPLEGGSGGGEGGLSLMLPGIAACGGFLRCPLLSGASAASSATHEQVFGLAFEAFDHLKTGAVIQAICVEQMRRHSF